MAIGGQLPVNGLLEPQIPDDGCGPEIKGLPDRLLQHLIRHGAGAEGLHQDGNRLGHTDGVGQLNLAPLGQPGGHHGFGHPPGGVGRGAVHLGGVLSGERAAAVGGGPAVSIHNDLPSGETRVPLGPADDKAPGGVDIDLRVLVH